MKKQAVDMQKNKNPSASSKKAIHIFAAILFSLLTLAILLAGLGLGYQQVYAQKFYPGIKIAGYDLSGDDKQSAQNFLELKTKNIAEQKVKIDTGTETKENSLNDLGVSIDTKATIEEAYNYGRDKNVFNSIGEEFVALFYNKDFSLKVIFDNNKMLEKLTAIAPDLSKDAQNATFVVDDQNNISIKAEEEGSAINLEKFKEDLTEKINNSSLQEIVVLTKTAVEPKILSAQTEELQPFFSQIVSEKMFFNDAGINKTYSATAKDLAAWLAVKEENGAEISLVVNEEGIKSYAEALAKKTNKKVINRKINAVTGAVVTEGQDGRSLDENKLTEEIKNFLSNRLNNQDNINNTLVLIITDVPKEEQEVQPEEIKTSGGTPGLAGGQYIELNLSQQVLYLFNGEQQIGAYSVSTGKWSMPTPIGTRYVQGKEARAWSAKYGLYMPYWNDIGGGYGIHELPEWPGGYKEGEGHLGTPVSHGCIRLGVGAAEFVYNWAPIGTPVFIHK